MKKSLLHFTLLAAVIGLLYSCGEAQLEDRICANTCKDETVTEILENVKGRIKGSIIDINPEYIDKSEYSLSNEFTLVPCNLNDNDKIEGRIVIVSGKKMNCCNLITLPAVRPGFGCKFEITSIRSINDTDQ